MHYEILVPALLVGFALGFGVAVLFRIVRLRMSKELVEETKAESDRSTQELMNQMRDSFGSLSVDALMKVSGEVVKLAGETLGGQQRQSATDLEAKKGLIDQQLAGMSTQLDAVQKLMQSLEADRERKFGELTSQLKLAGEQTALLGKTTGALREALASTRVRGQWGERMANDVLRVAGLKEGINYRRQTVQQETGNRPDFTFLLPHDLMLNMDVKFPLDNYLKAINPENPDDVEGHTAGFIGDVRARIKEITTREYIDEDHGTVSCVLLFVPVESVFAFAQENDAELIDYALKYHVVLCSPSTLFAVLAVIHQAVDTFAVEQRSKEMLAILGAFGKQWKAFVTEFDKLGKHLRQANEDYAELMDTRTRLLQRKIDDVDKLREQEGIALLPETGAIEASAEVTTESRSGDSNET